MSSKGWIGELRQATTAEGLTDAESNIINVTQTLGNDIMGAYAFGSRLPTALLEGNMTMGFTIEKYYVNNTWQAFCYSATTLTERYVRIYPLGSASNKPYLTLLGKFSNWRLGVPQGSQVTENLDFTGRTIATGTV